MQLAILIVLIILGTAAITAALYFALKKKRYTCAAGKCVPSKCDSSALNCYKDETCGTGCSLPPVPPGPPKPQDTWFCDNGACIKGKCELGEDNCFEDEKCGGKGCVKPPPVVDTWFCDAGTCKAGKCPSEYNCYHEWTCGDKCIVPPLGQTYACAADKCIPSTCQVGSSDPNCYKEPDCSNKCTLPPAVQTYSCDKGACVKSTCNINDKGCYSSADCGVDGCSSAVGPYTLVWSGGDPINSTCAGGNTDHVGKAPYEIARSTYVALASCLPSDVMLGLQKPAGAWWNHISGAAPKKAANPDAFPIRLLSIGGSGATRASDWRQMLDSSNLPAILTFFKTLWDDYGIRGIDWDIEIATFEHSIVRGILNINAALRTQLHDKFVIGFTLFASYTHPGDAHTLYASAFAQSLPKPTYFCVMLYGNTMYTVDSPNSGSGGVSWSAYLDSGSSDLACLTDRNAANFPAGTKTVLDMFPGDSVLFAGVILSGKYPCDKTCFEYLKQLVDAGKIQGVAIWCFGAYAAECQCNGQDPKAYDKMMLINQILDYFKGAAPELPTQAAFANVVGAANTPWMFDGKTLTGGGCIPASSQSSFLRRGGY